MYYLTEEDNKKIEEWVKAHSIPCRNNFFDYYKRDIDKRNTTGFLGVTKLNKKYRAAIMIDGINYRKSSFNTPEEAYKWRLQKEKEMMTYQ